MGESNSVRFVISHFVVKAQWPGEASLLVKAWDTDFHLKYLEK